MSSLEGLVRLQRWTLDEKRRTLGDLERLAVRLEADLQRLEREIEAERAAVGESLDGARVFPLYAGAALKRRERLEQSLRKVREEREQARAEVQTAFEELKKVEQTRANLEQRRQQRLKRKEELQLDEVALTQHQRRGQG